MKKEIKKMKGALEADEAITGTIVEPHCWAMVIQRGVGKLELVSIFREVGGGNADLAFEMVRQSQNIWRIKANGIEISQPFGAVINIIYGHWVMFSEERPTQKEIDAFADHYRRMFPNESK